jgi:hypothetical protein
MKKRKNMFFDRLRYEIRLMGSAMLFTPCLIIIVGSLLAVVLHLSHSKTINLFTACLEMFLPLATGVFVATLCGHDPAMELQLTFPERYRRTVIYRLAIITLWTACVAIIASMLLGWVGLEKTQQLTSSLPVMVRWGAAQLTWLAPLLWFVAIGLFLALLLRSRAASIALLGGIWVAQNLMYGLIIDTAWLHPVFLFATTLTPLSILSSFWLANRWELLGTAVMFLLIGWLQLDQTEMLLQKAQGDE